MALRSVVLESFEAVILHGESHVSDLDFPDMEQLLLAVFHLFAWRLEPEQP